MLRGFHYILFVVCYWFSSALWADDVTFVADRYYPYNGIPNSPDPGYMIEIINYAMALGGHTVSYQLMSWDRAIEQVEAGKKNCLIATYKNEAPNLIFPDIHQGADQIAFFQRVDDDWQYDGVDSLKQIKLAVIDNYTYQDEVDQYISTHKGSSSVLSTRGQFALEQNLISLMKGDVDVVVDSEVVIKSALKKLKLQGKVKYSSAADVLSKNYVGCSPELESSQNYVRLIARATKELRESKKLDAILSKYGLQDWLGLNAIDN